MPRNLVAVARILAAISDDLHDGNAEEIAVAVVLRAVRVAILSERTLTLSAQIQPWIVALETELEQEEKSRNL
jgi:hypothetical protein